MKFDQTAIRFTKYHALGNDYLVIEPDDAKPALSRAAIQHICQRHTGVGADGVLILTAPQQGASFGVAIYNPDGSQAEKSGNGLRIFSLWLWHRGLVSHEPFKIWTAGGIVKAAVLPGGKEVKLEMGPASFNSRLIPVKGPERDVINETIVVAGIELRYCAVTLGNPHCVVLRDSARREEALAWGPLIENDDRFPNRTNVQFMEVIDRDNLRIEIWERGAGYTLASGSSSCAAAAAAHRLGLCNHKVKVHNPGGILSVEILPDDHLILSGPVSRVAEGLYYLPESL